MARFHYRAVSNDGEVHSGDIDAEDEQGVLLQLRAKGLIPIEIGTRRGWQSLLQIDVNEVLGRTRSRKMVLHFTQNLASLLHSGVALDRSLDIMLRVDPDPQMQQLIAPIQEGVRRGISLSRVMGERPEMTHLSAVQRRRPSTHEGRQRYPVPSALASAEFVGG